ncbi:MAG: HlyD family efflux transporter periplasmic adaptor subunit [Rhodospirillales bacterium]|nr:HlyD family efflux transporter periplasmic adaptor subunit [Rhodospirillales bacterium]
MRTRSFRWLLWALALGAVAALVLLSLRRAPIPVELATIGRATVQQTVDEDGRTRVRERYVVAAPLAGTLQRVALQEGDRVAAGQVLTVLAANPAMLLDPRTRSELEQRLAAAQATQLRMTAMVARAEAQAQQAQADLERSQKLAAGNIVSRSQLEHEQLAVTVNARLLEVARFEQRAAAYEVQQARAALAASRAVTEPSRSELFDVRAPVAGVVLRILQKSEAPVAIGAPLLEIGDLADLEVVVDVLSSDAVGIHPGTPVQIEHWGGAGALAARVRRVEPAAFTKISALGVEEQRVNVVIDITAPAAERAGLGDGFRVDARILLRSAADAVAVPTSALFRDGEGWAVFVDAQGVARKRSVQVTLRGADLAAIGAGLKPGERVILFPGDAIADGTRVRGL